MDTKKKVNPLNKVLKRIKDLLAITVVRYIIHQTNVGAMGKQNSMENATIVISMIIEKMSSKRNPRLKENVINARSMDTNLLNEKPRY